MTTTKTKRQKRRISMRLVWLVVAIVAFFVPLVFEFDGLSPAGHRMFSIFLIAIVLWVAEPIPLFGTAALIILLEVLMISDKAIADLPVDFTPRAFRDYYAALADPVLLLVLGGFFLAMGSSHFRLDRAMGRLLLVRFGNEPSKIMLGLMIITGAFSMFMSNTAVTATMMAVVIPVVAALPSHDRIRVGMVLAIPFAANVGGMGTPVGTPPNAIAIGQLAGSGISISFGKWMLLALPGAIILLLITWWLLRIMFPTDTKEIELKIEGEFDRSRDARIFYAVFLVTVALWLTESFHGIPSSIVGFVPVVALLTTGVLSEKDLQAVQWHVLWLIAGGIALGRGIVDSGLDEWVVGLISWESLGATLIIGTFAAVTLALSTVMSNSASANLLVPLGVSLAMSGTVDVDPMIVGFTISMAASLAMALPISTPTNAVAYSSGLIKTADMAKTGVIVGVIGVLLFVFAMPLFWSALGIA